MVNVLTGFGKASIPLIDEDVGEEEEEEEEGVGVTVDLTDEAGDKERWDFDGLEPASYPAASSINESIVGRSSETGAGGGGRGRLGVLEGDLKCCL